MVELKAVSSHWYVCSGSGAAIDFSLACALNSFEAGSGGSTVWSGMWGFGRIGDVIVCFLTRHGPVSFTSSMWLLKLSWQETLKSAGGEAKAYFTSGGDDEDEDEDEDDGEVHEHTYESTEDNRDESTHTRADV